VLDEGGLSGESALQAELRVEPATTTRREELTARGTLLNAGAEPLTLELAPLSSPSLALEIVDAGGAPLLLPPPPVPRADVENVTLGPGERHAVEYRGFVPQWTKPGSYRARLRYLGRVRSDEREPARILSAWAEFTIADEGTT
jgi:hypothetical protein